MTRWGVLLAATIVLLMWALLSVRPAYPDAAPLDPCPPLAFVVGSGYVATVRCPVYLPLIVKEDAP
jgi:hypothetical protein